MMTEIKVSADILLVVAPIEDGAESRRQREQAAVGAILATYLSPHAVVRHTPEGRPYVDGPVKISVSHSRHLAAVAFSSGTEIGVDVEENRTAQLMKVADRFLTPEEKEIFLPDRLAEAWTIKEAAFKALGGGFPDFRTIKICRDGLIRAGNAVLSVVLKREFSDPTPAIITIVELKTH